MADEDEYEIEDYELTDTDGVDSALNLGDESSVSPAQYGNNQPVIVGTISGMQWGDFGGSFYAINGLAVIPKPPLADTVGGAGLLEKAEFKKLQGKKPTLGSGTLNLPLAQAPTGACDGTVDDDTPGGIVGIGYSEDGVFSIKDGYARIPRPPEQGYFPDGLYNAATGEKITWQTFLAGTSPVPLSEPAEGLRIMAFHLGKFITFYLERV